MAAAIQSPPPSNTNHLGSNRKREQPSRVYQEITPTIYPPPSRSSPPHPHPCPPPPPLGGNRHWLVEKNVSVSYCIEVRNCETSFSELMHKSARGTRGLGHTFEDRLYFTWDIPEQKWIPKKLVAPTVPKPAPKPAPKRGKQPAAASSSIPVADGEMCSCSSLCGTARGSSALSLFRSWGRQKTDEWMQGFRIFLTCIMRMAPSASMHVTANPRYLSDLQQETDQP